MAQSKIRPVVIGDESLQDWREIGCGGFGVVHRVRHKYWGFDVAIKLLHHDSGVVHHLHKEAESMGEAISPFVLMILGKYCGSPPGMGPSRRVGIMMEFMEKGSLRSLHKSMGGPGPWPLAFRLAHQVGLGMNFLHRKNPPLLHRDLKPDNVLLDDCLNAKLTDFGLSTESASVLMSSTSETRPEGGTLAYMPPEAFNLSYKPVRAYDVYSYGILLWSIHTGKVPYPDARAEIVEFRISRGDRPDTDEIDQGKAEGIGELVALMRKCWNSSPTERPPFGECIKVTELVLSRHAQEVNGAVYQVLTKLNQNTLGYQRTAMITRTMQENLRTLLQNAAEKNHSAVSAVSVKPEDPIKQDVMDSLTPELSVKEKAAFVDRHRAKLIQNASMVLVMAEELGSMVHPERYSEIKAKQTSQGQMRELYKPLNSGGEKVKAAFYDALKKHEPNLVERLETES